MYKARYVPLRGGVYARQDQFFINVAPEGSKMPRYFPITEREAAEKMKMKFDPRVMAQILLNAA